MWNSLEIYHLSEIAVLCRHCFIQAHLDCTRAWSQKVKVTAKHCLCIILSHSLGCKPQAFIRVQILFSNHLFCQQSLRLDWSIVQENATNPQCCSRKVECGFFFCLKKWLKWHIHYENICFDFPANLLHKQKNWAKGTAWVEAWI